MNGMHIRSVDLNLIPVFDAIMSEGSLSAAAGRLGMSQSAVSHALARLRAITGDELFVRTGRGMRPTPHAVALAGPLQSAVDLCRLAFARPTEAPLLPHGRAFVLDLPVGFDLVFVPPLLAEARASGIEARFQINSDRAGDLVSDLRSGETELALDVEPAKGRRLRCQPLYDDEFLVCARKGGIDLLDGLTQETYLAAEHVTLKWTRHSEGSPVDVRLSALGIERSVSISMPTLAGCATIVSGSNALFTIHRRIANVLAARFDLQLHAMPFPIAPVTLYAIWHDRLDDDVGHKWLRNALARIAGNL